MLPTITIPPKTSLGVGHTSRRVVFDSSAKSIFQLLRRERLSFFAIPVNDHVLITDFMCRKRLRCIGNVGRERALSTEGRMSKVSGF